MADPLVSSELFHTHSTWCNYRRYMDGTGLPVPAPSSGSRPPSRRPSLSGGDGLPPRPPARAASMHDASTGTEPFAELNPLPPGSV